MNRAITFRSRIMIYFSALLVGVIGLIGGAIFIAMKWSMLNDVDARLHQVLDEIVSPDGVLNPPYVEIDHEGQRSILVQVPDVNAFQLPGIYVQIWNLSEGKELYSASDNFSYKSPLDPYNLGTTIEIYSNVKIDGVNLRVITHPIIVQDRVVGNAQAATTLTSIENATDTLLKIMIGAGIIGLLISLILGDLLAQRVLTPVSAIVETAQSITATSDLKQRIHYVGPKDELGSMVAAFNDTLTRLEKLFWVQRRFVGDVSHELRTPLTTIRGNLDLIRLYGSDPISIKAMESEVERMSRLIDDLLLLALADSGQIPLTRVPVDLVQLVMGVYKEAILLDQGKHVITMGRIVPVRVLGDPDRLKQLALNLVTNAIKYTPSKGTVELSMRRQEDQIHLIVSDNGIGIPADDLEHIFDRFYRVEKARSRAAGGTGLGLSIAQWVAEVHNGTIKVESIAGKGTTFTVVLPIMDDKVIVQSEKVVTRPDVVPSQTL